MNIFFIWRINKFNLGYIEIEYIIFVTIYILKHIIYIIILFGLFIMIVIFKYIIDWNDWEKNNCYVFKNDLLIWII